MLHGSNGADDFGDALVGLMQSIHVTKSEFEATVASIEFCFPKFKHGLQWSRAVIRGWQIHHMPRHTVPLGRAHANLVAVHLVALSAPRLGTGGFVQRELGLRPNELLAFGTTDVSFPEHQHPPRTSRAAVAL